MGFKQKDIVLFPFPFSNLEQEKVRPAIIISNNKFNNNSLDRIMVPLTSVLKKKPYSASVLQEDLISGRLVTKSIIRADKIFSLEKDLIKVRIGVISNKKFKEIIEKIKRMF